MSAFEGKADNGLEFAKLPGSLESRAKSYGRNATSRASVQLDRKQPSRKFHRNCVTAMEFLFV
jgi:hypothetical protein